MVRDETDTAVVVGPDLRGGLKEGQMVGNVELICQMEERHRVAFATPLMTIL